MAEQETPSILLGLQERAWIGQARRQLLQNLKDVDTEGALLKALAGDDDYLQKALESLGALSRERDAVMKALKEYGRNDRGLDGFIEALEGLAEVITEAKEEVKEEVKGEVLEDMEELSQAKEEDAMEDLKEEYMKEEVKEEALEALEGLKEEDSERMFPGHLKTGDRFDISSD